MPLVSALWRQTLVLTVPTHDSSTAVHTCCRPAVTMSQCRRELNAMMYKRFHVSPKCWLARCCRITEQKSLLINREHTVRSNPKMNLPDLNLLRISMECSEPRRVIMISVQFQRSKVSKTSRKRSKSRTHFEPSGDLWTTDSWETKLALAASSTA